MLNQVKGNNVLIDHNNFGKICGYVEQNNLLFEYLTPRELLSFGSKLKVKFEENALKTKVENLISQVSILLIFKLADIMSQSFEEEKEKLERYVMVIYILSIMGLVIGYIWLKEQSNGNYIIKRSLTFGGVLSLFYMVMNYWAYLDDYSKLIMLGLSISFIIYYIYKI